MFVRQFLLSLVQNIATGFCYDVIFAEIINLRITSQFSLELFRVHSQTLPVEDLAVETAVCTLTKSRLEDRQRMKHLAWRYLSSYFTSKHNNQNKYAIRRNTTYSTKFSRADGRVRMWRFSNVPGNNSVLIFRPCWWFGSIKIDDFSLGATKTSHPDAALCQRNLHWILSPRKLKTYTTYSVDKMLSIKPKDASLALYGNVCEWLSPLTSHILLSGISESVLRRK